MVNDGSLLSPNIPCQGANTNLLCHLLEVPIGDSRVTSLPANINLLDQSVDTVLWVKPVAARSTPAHLEVHSDVIVQIGAMALSLTVGKLASKVERTAQIPCGASRRLLVGVRNPGLPTVVARCGAKSSNRKKKNERVEELHGV